MCKHPYSQNIGLSSNHLTTAAVWIVPADTVSEAVMWLVGQVCGWGLQASSNTVSVFEQCNLLHIYNPREQTAKNKWQI